MKAPPRRPTKRRLSPRMVRLALILALVALGVRAGLASATFMTPGGAILGWSDRPVVHCALCGVAVPTARPNQPAPAPLTPASYAALLTKHLSLDDERPIKPTRLAPRQDVGQEQQRRIMLVEVRHRRPGQ